MSTQTTCSYIYLLRVSFTLLLQTVPVYVNKNYLLLYIPTSCILNSTPTNSPCICQHKLLAPIYSLLRVSLTLLLQTVPVYVNTNYMLLYIPTSCILNSTPTNSPCICQHKLHAPIYTYFVYPSLYSYKQSLYMSTQTTCSYIYLLRVSLTLLLQTVPVYVNTNYLLLYIPTSCILNSRTNEHNISYIGTK